MTLGMILTTSLTPAVVGAVKDSRVIDTPYGVVEQQLLTVGYETVVAIRRSTGASLRPPHAVNYRANMFAFAMAGVTRVLSTNIVGSLHKGLPPGSIVVPDQFLDFTRDRSNTIFDHYGHRHVDVAEPFCARMRDQVAESSKLAGVDVHRDGTYVAVEGPRYETRAEVTAFARLGGDVVGMTCATEAILAREIGLCFATVTLVSNFGAGIAAEGLDPSTMVDTAQRVGTDYRDLVRRTVAEIAETEPTRCCRPAQPHTQPAWRNQMLGLSG